MSVKLSLNEVLNRFMSIHGNKYDYSNFQYNGVFDKSEIICNKHGTFLQSYNNHIRGSGCVKCANDNKRIGADKFKNIANKIHKNKYSYDKVVYKNNKTKVIVTCLKHGDFKIAPSEHINLFQGCKKCYYDKTRKTKEEFITESKLNHKHDPYPLSYEKVKYINNHTSVIITCKKHGDFNQTPVAHKNNGCPICGKTISRNEKKWISILQKNNKYIICGTRANFKINGRLIKPDGYCVNTNTIYEFYGDYIHGNPNIYHENDLNTKLNKTFGALYKKTIDREYFLKKHGFKIISIWESDFKRIYKNGL